ESSAARRKDLVYAASLFHGEFKGCLPELERQTVCGVCGVKRSRVSSHASYLPVHGTTRVFSKCLRDAPYSPSKQLQEHSDRTHAVLTRCLRSLVVFRSGA